MAAAAFEALGGFMSSEGAGSVEAAVEADSTWDGERRLRASRVGGQRWAAKAVGRHVRRGGLQVSSLRSRCRVGGLPEPAAPAGQWCQAQVSNPGLEGAHVYVDLVGGLRPLAL